MTKRRDTRPDPRGGRYKVIMVRDHPDETPDAGSPLQPDGGCAANDRLTVYFDGSCPLCRLEIDHYAAQPGAGDLTFIDVATSLADTGPDLARTAAMARFHVRLPGGRLVSGAEAFTEIWQRLPDWRFAARMARLPGALAVIDAIYRMFLPLRPRLSSLVGWWQRRQQDRRY